MINFINNKSNDYINKKIIYFIRHENDLDFLLPLILSTKKKKIVFWKKINKKDVRIQYLLDNKYDLIFLNYFEKTDFIKFFLLVIRKFSKTVYCLIEKTLNNISISSLKKNLQSKLSNAIVMDYEIIAFDHIMDNSVIEINNYFKNISKNGLKLISLPHGINPFMNNITNHRLTDFLTTDMKIYDVVYCSDERQFKTFINKNKKILPSLRYTKEYVNFFLDKILINNNSYYENNKLNFLYLHSKFFGNIHKEEVIRLFKILNKYKNCKLIFKKHPRGGYREVKKLFNFKNFTITEEHTISSILNCDFVICVQSIAVYDALILGKPVIFPTYISSNIFDPNILKYCFVVNSPDELVTCINDISKNKFDFKFIKYEGVDFSNSLQKWKKSLESII